MNVPFFFHQQRIYSREAFEEDSVALEAVDVDFYPGNKLVRALIGPQTIKLGKTRERKIERTHRSYFLYNPNAVRTWRKLFPLSTSSNAVHEANEFLSLKLTKENAVDYIKYFGLVVEGEDGPFYFIDNTDEILWADNVSKEDKDRLIGTLSTHSPLLENGQFDVRLKKPKPLLYHRPMSWKYQRYTTARRIHRLCAF